MSKPCAMPGLLMRCVCCLVAGLLLCACSQQRKSQGAPYSVTVCGNDKESVEAVEARLTLSFIPHLPQRERLFHVERTGNEQKGHLARCLVTIEADSTRYRDTRLLRTANRWAQPQLVLRITTPSATHLRHFLKTRGDSLRHQIEGFEQRQTIGELQRRHERKVEQRMRQLTGHALCVPKSLNATKEGKDFIWVAEGEGHDPLNICLYSYPDTRLDADRLIHMRDSIMKVNIPGELPGTYMQTEPLWEPTVQLIGKGETEELVLHGLWSIHGDAMGGPLVCRVRLDAQRKRVIVAEAFIFAPGKRKRPHLTLAEAIISTLD